MIIQPGGELLSKRWAAVIFALNTAMYIICIMHLHCKLFAIYTTIIVHFIHDTWHCTLCTLYSAVIHRYLHCTRQTSPVLPLKTKLWVVPPPPLCSSTRPPSTLLYKIQNIIQHLSTLRILVGYWAWHFSFVPTLHSFTFCGM